MSFYPLTVKICEMVLQRLLCIVNDTFNHHRNIQALMVEIYEIKNNLNSPIMDFMLIGEMTQILEMFKSLLQKEKEL